MDKLLEIERTKADVAEKARAQLAAELDLIKKQLDLESENIQKCKKFLEPDEIQKLEESNPEKSSSPSSLETGLSISEHILLKYKRSNELRTFFEQKYQNQTQEIYQLQQNSIGL